MKLSPEQLDELTRFVEAGDTAKIESLLDAIYFQRRRLELAELERLKRRSNRPWIPEF